MGKYSHLVKGLLSVAQFGVSLVTPPLCMALFAAWLMKKYELGIWVMIVCLVIGLLTAASTAIDFIRSSNKKARESTKDIPLSFRKHM